MARILDLSPSAGIAGAGVPDQDVVVIDVAWTPEAGSAEFPLRPILERVLARVNVVDDSLAILDDWAGRSGMPDAFVADDVTWWYRNRMLIRWSVHELVLWRHVLGELLAASPESYRAVRLPPGRPLLRAAALATGLLPVSPPEGTRRTTAGRALRRVRRVWRRLWRSARRVAGFPRTSAEHRRRLAILDNRVEGLRARSGGVLAVASAGFFQVLDDGGQPRFADPHLALVLDRLAGLGVPTATAVLAIDHRSDDDWQRIEGDPTMIPDSYVWTRWGRREDRELGPGPTRARVREAGGAPAEVDGVDLGPAIQEIVLASAGRWLASQRRWLRWAERLLVELRPGVMLIDHEGVRTPWLAAARRLGIPIVAVQHGVIYPNNPEYCRPPHPSDVRPDMTCVFGTYERDLLLAEGGYDAMKVAVTGSSRSDPDTTSKAGTPTEREDVRAELGVRQEDRLLVVSVAHNPVMGDLHSLTMLGRVLGGPLPGIHLAIKLHPQDRAESRHQELLEGLARAGGYSAPPVSIVRKADLYRLLRAADAHLGQYSTVLTDAVVAGTPNMIAVGQAYVDVLGWSAAGVATPVRTPADVRSFMAGPARPSPVARQQFLDRHFRQGDATGRIVDVIGQFLPGSGGRPR